MRATPRAGDANTWKVGLTWDTPIPGIRFRALQSRDIRAPNLSELIPPLQGANGGFQNEFTGNLTPQNIIGATGGNLNLKPEKAQTTEVGIVWQPDFIPGFQASVDYYRIAVKGAIISLSSQQIEHKCFEQAVLNISQGSDACSVHTIRTSNNQPQSVANPGGPPWAPVSFRARSSPSSPRRSMPLPSLPMASILKRRTRSICRITTFPAPSCCGR